MINLKKKAQGLSMNVVIIAVLALIVLALLIFVLGKSVLDFRSGASEAKSSICLTHFDRSCQADSCNGIYTTAVGVVSHPRDCAENEVCCERKG